MNLQALCAETGLYKIYPTDYYMGWNDLKSGWKVVIIWGGVAFILSSILSLIVGVLEFFVVSGLLLFFVGAPIGWLFGTISHKEKGISEVEQDSLVLNKVKFYLFDVSLMLFLLLALTLILSIIGGVVACDISDAGIELSAGDMVVAICHDTPIPMLVNFPMFFIFLMNIILLFIYSVKKYKSFSEIEITQRAIVLSSIFGVILWFIDLSLLLAIGGI